MKKKHQKLYILTKTVHLVKKLTKSNDFPRRRGKSDFYISLGDLKTKFSSPNCSLQRFFGSVRLYIYPAGKSTASHFLVHLSQKKKMRMTLLLMQMPS